MYQFITNGELEKELYRRLKEIDDNKPWLECQMHKLCTEERQKAMLKILDEKGLDNFWDVQTEATYITNRYPNLDFPAVVREELETELEKRLYDKLIQIEGGSEWWLAFIFNCFHTEEIMLKMLGFLNEGNDNFERIWTYAAHLSIDYHHRDCDWYDPDDTSEEGDDEEV